MKIKHSITIEEKKKYVLSKSADFEILEICKKLEKMKLIKKDKLLIKLIKSQLERDWRKPLLKTLKKILRRMKK